jgi:hypothetical protein
VDREDVRGQGFGARRAVTKITGVAFFARLTASSASKPERPGSMIVEEHEALRPRPDQEERVLAVCGERHLVAFLAEPALEKARKLRFILDDEIPHAKVSYRRKGSSVHERDFIRRTRTRTASRGSATQ